MKPVCSLYPKFNPAGEATAEESGLFTGEATATLLSQKFKSYGIYYKHTLQLRDATAICKYPELPYSL